MSHNLERVLAIYERRKEKERQLIELLRDPDVQDLVRALTTVSAEDAVAERRRPSASEETPTEGLRAAIRGLYGALPQAFGYPEVLERLRAQSFEFSGDPISAIRNQLYSLNKMGELTLVRRGRSGIPNSYQVAGKSSAHGEANAMKLNT